MYLGQYDALAEAIAALDREIDAAIGRIDEERESAGQAPFRAASRDVCEIPGINVLAANNDPRGNRSRYGAFPNATEPEELDAAADQFGRRAAWADRRRQNPLEAREGSPGSRGRGRWKCPRFEVMGPLRQTISRSPG